MASMLIDMSLAMASSVYLHPRQQTMPSEAALLIASLRRCDTAHDYYLFQQDLLHRVVEIQERWAGCQRVVKRLRAGKAVPADAPSVDMPDGSDLPEFWKTEAAVCERIDRQLRSIADAMAWRRFGHNRAVIVALSRNQHPGPMVRKTGLARELKLVEDMWHREGKFVLLHDLTSCLRIGDASVFTEDDQYYEVALEEVKTDDGRSVSRQRRRQRSAEEAIRSGGPLPGKEVGRLVPLDIAYRTRLEALGAAFALAGTRAIQSVKAGPGQTALAVEIARGYQRWEEQAFLDNTALVHLRGLKRAGVSAEGSLICVRSDDLVARVPTAPPWAIYPFSPELCARLICDYALFIVTMDIDIILDALSDAGLSGDWRLPRGQQIHDHGVTALVVTDGRRTLGLTWSTIQQSLLLELADLRTWAAGIAAVLQSQVGEHPWPVFTREHAVWV